MAAATIVHDTSEAVELCPPYGLYLKPITKMTISVALPQLKQPGKSISNWEVMERLKGMVQHHQFSTLRISKSTMDFIRFEGEVENKSLVKSFLACLDGKTIKLSGFSDILKVRAAEFKVDFPTRHDWDSFFRDAKDMNETLPGERPDTIHLEGLPCKWFSLKESGSEKPSEEVLVRVFERFGEIRNVDIPMLDPYREEMTGRNFHTFSFGGHLNFEAYVQYREYAGFIQAMSALRGMKLMFKGEDGKAVACNIKVRGRPEEGAAGCTPKGLGHREGRLGPPRCRRRVCVSGNVGRKGHSCSPSLPLIETAVCSMMAMDSGSCWLPMPPWWRSGPLGAASWAWALGGEGSWPWSGGRPAAGRGRGYALTGTGAGRTGLWARSCFQQKGPSWNGWGPECSFRASPTPSPKVPPVQGVWGPAVCGEPEADRLVGAGPSAHTGRCELVLTLPRPASEGLFRFHQTLE